MHDTKCVQQKLGFFLCRLDPFHDHAAWLVQWLTLVHGICQRVMQSSINLQDIAIGAFL